MGANGSHHKPDWLEKGEATNSLKRSASLRKETKSSPGRIDKLRRSFRDSLRRKKNPISSLASPKDLWPNDERKVRNGGIYFHVEYYGCIEVTKFQNMEQSCEKSFEELRNSRQKPKKAVLYISRHEIRIVEAATLNLLIDQILDKVKYCAHLKIVNEGFAYISRDTSAQRWMCYGFLATDDPGMRLSHAMKCAFTALLEDKQRLDRIYVDVSLFPKSERNDRAYLPQTNTRIVSEVMKNATRKPQPAILSNLKRQGSFQGLIRLGREPSTLQRQLSLRISDAEKKGPHDHHQHSLDRRAPTSQLIQLKNPDCPLSEESPTHSSDPSLSKNVDHVSAICKQFRKELSLLTKDDAVLVSIPTEPNGSTPITARELFLKDMNDFSKSIQLKPTIINLSTLAQKSSTSVKSFPLPEESPSSVNLSQTADQARALCNQFLKGTSLLTKDDDFLSSIASEPSCSTQLTARELFFEEMNDFSKLIELNTANNLSTLEEKSSADIKTNYELLSECFTVKDTNYKSQSQPSRVSSSGILLTAPPRPPKPARYQLPNLYTDSPWLLRNTVQLTTNVSDSSSSLASAIKPLPAPRTHRTYSSSSADAILNPTVAAAEDYQDPFDIAWAESVIDRAKPTEPGTESTNPFL